MLGVRVRRHLVLIGALGLASAVPIHAADPVFSAATLVKPDGEADIPYHGTIATEASDADGDALSFAKLSGAAWLSVAGDGTLYGTPGTLDTGPSSFGVSVTDGSGSDTATLEIRVDPSTGGLTLFDSVVQPYVNDPDNHSYYRNAEDFLNQTQYYDLWNDTLGTLPTGKRVVVAQVETGHADPVLFPAKIFIPHPVGLEAHADTVGKILYGDEPYEDWNARFHFGFAPGIPAIHSFTSGAFRTDVLKMTASNANVRQPGGVLPHFEAPLHVVNVSNTGGSGAHPNNVRAMDYLLDEQDILAVTAMPGSLSTNGSLSGVLWNSIVVGKASTDLAYPGGTDYENVGGHRRDKPDLVSASYVSGFGGGASSWTVPTVASGAAMLLDYALGDPAKANAAHNVVLKAILMAGARKSLLASPVYDQWGNLIATTFDPPYTWTNDPPLQPLDLHYGVGTFSLSRSFEIFVGGEQAAGQPSRHTGWAHGSVGQGGIDLYPFELISGYQGFSTVLTWNREVFPDGDTAYDFVVADLSLTLERDVDGGWVVIASSQDPGNNVEHVYVSEHLFPGHYRLVVENVSSTPAAYGLAWIQGASAGEAIPALSSWGAASLVILLLAAGSVLLRRRVAAGQLDVVERTGRRPH